ncbi:2Fe-2S iron-sulfur cluster binding domain-containing protein [archaeon]|nr:MAG: 2Fe-2S iron-sulfur cluster binding domain-containing protein [archaeon]
MVEVQGELGKTVLDVAIANNVDIEGACGGELACSTCHVIVPRDIYDKLPAKKEEEEDMLDLAMGLTPT